jgi:hypothetical protein
MNFSNKATAPMLNTIAVLVLEYQPDCLSQYAPGRSSVVYLGLSINAVLLHEVHVVQYGADAILSVLRSKVCHRAVTLMEISKFDPIQ